MHPKYLFQRPGTRVMARRNLRLPAGSDGHALGVRLVVASDIHARDDWFDRAAVDWLVDAINGIDNVTAIALVGDFVGDDPTAIDWAAESFGSITAPWFATLGNHDHWTDPARISNALSSAGGTMLTNRSCELGPVTLAGIDSCWGGQPDAVAAFADVAADATTIVLGHEPHLATMHSHFLHIAGHTHAGQARLPIPWLGTKLARGWMPRYSDPYPAGTYRRGDRSWVHTTAGVGFSTISWRLATPPEIVVIDL